MNLLESFTETDEILNWAKGRESSNTKVADLWTFMNFQKRIEASENGIRKVEIKNVLSTYVQNQKLDIYMEFGSN